MYLIVKVEQNNPRNMLRVHTRFIYFTFNNLTIRICVTELSWIYDLLFFFQKKIKIGRKSKAQLVVLVYNTGTEMHTTNVTTAMWRYMTSYTIVSWVCWLVSCVNKNRNIVHRVSIWWNWTATWNMIFTGVFRTNFSPSLACIMVHAWSKVAYTW